MKQKREVRARRGSNGAALVAAGLVCGLFSACGSLVPPAPAKQTFVLETPSCTEKEDEKAPSLMVSQVDSPAYLDTTEILFKEAKNTRAPYQLAEWAETPPRSIERLVLKRLNCTGMFRAVEGRSSIINPDFQLNLRLNEFLHDATSTPGKAIVSVSAELIDMRNRKLIARQEFSEQEAVSAVGVTHTVEAFQADTAKLLTEMDTWMSGAMAEVPAQEAPNKSP